MVGNIIIGAVILLLIAGIVRMQRPLPPWLLRWFGRADRRKELFPGEDLYRAHEAEQRLLDSFRDGQQH